MELFGVVLTAPAALFASTFYAVLLRHYVAPVAMLARLFRAGSVVVLALLVGELALLATLGSVRSRDMLGPSFALAHFLVFVLGTPALANLLVLRRRPSRLARWYAVAPCCAAFALALVLLQYAVSEALYGIDGASGPFRWP